MKLNLLACLAAVLLLAGCDSIGIGSGSGSGSVAGGSVSSVGSGSDSGNGSGGLGSSVVHHNPEPATMFLLGGGLAAYALLRRKNRKT